MGQGLVQALGLKFSFWHLGLWGSGDMNDQALGLSLVFGHLRLQGSGDMNDQRPRILRRFYVPATPTSKANPGMRTAARNPQKPPTALNPKSP